MKKGFPTVMSQCSKGVRSKLEGSDGWNEIWSKQELHKLIIAVQGICVGHDDSNQGMYNLVQSVKNFYFFYQKNWASVDDYKRDYKSYYETTVVYEATPSISNKLIKERASMTARDEVNPLTAKMKKVTIDVTETFLGCMFISSANRK